MKPGAKNQRNNENNISQNRKSTETEIMKRNQNRNSGAEKYKN